MAKFREPGTYHRQKRTTQPLPPVEKSKTSSGKLCKCGCRQRANPGYDFIKNHQRRNQKLLPLTKAMMSATKKLLWQNLSPEEKNIWMQAVYAGNNVKPNKKETILLNLLDELYPGEWKYTGNFTFWINGRNPDFTNINSKKKLIELFGDYWHKGENPQIKKNIFREFGWDTLVIWEHELENIEWVKDQIHWFMKKYPHRR